MIVTSFFARGLFLPMRERAAATDIWFLAVMAAAGAVSIPPDLF